MIRSLQPSDVPYVGSTWRASYASSAWARYCCSGPTAYDEQQRAVIDELLASSVVLVEEPHDANPNGLNIDGWACGWPGTTLHYAYVRRRLRGAGVARRLLAALDLRAGKRVVYTHQPAGLDLAKVPAGWRYSNGSLMLRREATMGKRINVREVHFEAQNAVPCHVKGNKDTRDNFPASLGARIEYDAGDREFIVYDEVSYGVPAKDPKGVDLPPWRVPREKAKRWSAYEPGEAPWEAKPEEAKP